MSPVPARAFVDLHCHLLPGVDDGAADLADSLAMAAQAQADGIAVVCATPHIRADHDVRIEDLCARTHALRSVLRSAGMTVDVRSGGEVAAARVRDLSGAELQTVSLGGSGTWILLEPPPGPMDDRLQDAADHLHAQGLRCLIAHPERHAGADAATRLRRLVDRGALVQVTAGLLADSGAAPTMLAWAAQGLVHGVGSDAHSSRVGRPVAVSAGLARLAAVPRLAGHLQWIARDAPLAMLDGRPVIAPF
jgi:protein-tyrosine phosphatase